MRRAGEAARAEGWGAPPWRLRAPHSAAPIPEHCEVAVVGGGLTGLTAAFRLARAGRDVHVFEAGRIGDGASGRTGGLVLEDTAAGPLDGAGGCIAGLEALLAETGIDCALELPGCWELVHRDGPEAPDRLWRDGDAALCVAGEVKGGGLDPAALLDGVAHAASAAGATLHEGCPVEHLKAGAPVALRAGAREVTTGQAIVALNAFTSALISVAEHLLHPALSVALCTEPLDDATLDAVGLRERRPFYTLDLPYLWGRPLPDGRLLFGAGLVFHPSGDLAQVDVRRGEGAAALRALATRVRGLHAALAGARVAAAWGGPVAFTRDRIPLLGPAGPNVLVAGAYAGHGISLSLRAGELLAAAIAEGRPLPAWGRLDR